MVGLAERIRAECTEPLARELAEAIGYQSRLLLGDSVAPASVDGVGGAHDTGESASAIAAAEPNVPRAPALDQSVLRTLADEMGSIEIVHVLIDTFLGELDERLRCIADGAARCDEEAIRAAHTLKGTAATIGATELAEISAVLETDLKDGHAEESLVAALPGVGDRCRSALSELVTVLEAA